MNVWFNNSPPYRGGLYYLNQTLRLIFFLNQSNEEPKKQIKDFHCVLLFHSDFPNGFAYYLKLVWK